MAPSPGSTIGSSVNGGGERIGVTATVRKIRGRTTGADRCVGTCFFKLLHSTMGIEHSIRCLSVARGLFVMRRHLKNTDSHALSLVALVATALVSGWAQAQTCNPNTARTAPDGRYSIVNDGAEVKDSVTRLIWQRCSLGQRWNGKTCLGIAAAHTWAKAQEVASVGAFSIHGGSAAAATAPVAVTSSTSSASAWRLPTHKELYSLTEQACRNPAINTAWFPATGAQFYWSASPLTDDASFAWGVDFSDGSGGYDAKDGSYSVRLVRSAQ